MKKIYFESDIKIVESYPGTDDFVYHFFTQKKDGKRYDVSLDIGNCRKATDDEGNEKLVIALNSHGLEPGILKVLREMNYTDPDFEDFHYNKKQESWYDVKLVDGESEFGADITCDGIFTIFRGEKGDGADLSDAEINALVERVTVIVGENFIDITVPHTLSAEQKKQARENIEVMSSLETMNKIDEEIGYIKSLLQTI